MLETEFQGTTNQPKQASVSIKNIAIGLVVGLVLVLGLVGIWYWLSLQAGKSNVEPLPTSNVSTEIKNSEDLTKLENELNDTNLDSELSGLDQNDVDSAQL